MPWPTMDQELASQMTFNASINAEINRRCPDDPRAAGKRAFWPLQEVEDGVGD